MFVRLLDSVIYFYIWIFWSMFALSFLTHPLLPVNLLSHVGMVTEQSLFWWGIYCIYIYFFIFNDQSLIGFEKIVIKENAVQCN